MNVVVTGGGTIAPIDDVRQITNVSSGSFAARIGEACLARGASVWHIATPTALLPFDRQARFNLDATDLRSEANRLIHLAQSYQNVRERFHPVVLPKGTVETYARTLRETLINQPIDVAFLAMAVSDFEPIAVPGKIKSNLRSLDIHCRPTPKVIRSVRDWSPNVYLVGFKLLSNVPDFDLIAAAREACRNNRADLTIANDLTTLRQGRHVVHLVEPAPRDDSDRRVETLGPDERLADLVVSSVFKRVEIKRAISTDNA